MEQQQIIYVDPDTTTAERVCTALAAAAPELVVRHADSQASALELLGSESVDCLVSEWLADPDRESFVDDVRSRAPTVPIVWFTSQPAAVVADALEDGRSEYVYNQGTDGQSVVLAHRIRSVINTPGSTRAPPASDDGTKMGLADLSTEIVDRSRAGILVFDANGKITLLNPVAADLLGRSVSEAIGTDCKGLDMRTTADRSLPMSDRPVARVLSSGEPVLDELVSIPGDAGRCWLSISASPLANGQQVDGVVVTLTDASAEVELETRLETILDRMTHGFVAFDTELRFTYFSNQAIKTNRYPREEYLGTTLSELHPHLERYEADLREVLETQEPTTVESYIPEPTDGWVRARLYPSETGVSVFFRDISEEKQRERELEQYKTIVESVQDGVCILDSNLEFVFANEAFAALTGYSAAELLGRNVRLITDTEGIKQANDHRERLSDGTADAVMLTGEILGASGERVPVEAWMTPLTLTGGEQGTVSVVRDVSFRKHTEAMFSALYDAAHDLLSVRSEREIAEIGVEAAASALGFEDAIVFSYDGSANVFQPLAHTPSAGTNYLGPTEIDASRTSVAGRAFFESELVTTADINELSAVCDSETPYRRAMFIPIGEHGVLFAGDTDPGTTTQRTLTVAELLGATVAAAFSRLSSEQRSETHRQTLAEQTAELEALTRTNDLVSELVDELLSATTREEVDAVVCSVLSSFDQHRFVWIGADESRGEAIVPRASAGHEEGYLDWVADHVAATDPTGIDEPAYRTLDTDSPVSVGRISTAWQTTPWRKEALSRGYQSVLSVPLVHNEITYGVLSVYAGSRDAFDGYTRTVLVGFGRIIGYVIESIETKRGLLADHRTEVELDISDDEDILHRLAARLETTIRFEGSVPQSKNRSLLYFTTSELPVEAVEAAASELCAIDSLRVVTRQTETTLFEATVCGPVLAATLVDCGAIPTRIDTDGEHQHVVVMIPPSTDVRAFMKRIGTEYPSTTVASRRDRDRKIRTRETFQMELLEELTQRQQETLRTAYFARYFESPRGSTGTEVGQALGISQPTFTYHLRAALKTIVTMLFEEPESPTLDG